MDENDYDIIYDLSYIVGLLVKYFFTRFFFYLGSLLEHIYITVTCQPLL